MEVRAVLKDHFILVYVHQDSRPDISQRYERPGWPATIIFGPDGKEIAKLTQLSQLRVTLANIPYKSGAVVKRSSLQGRD